jgi:hypothetical protein
MKYNDYDNVTKDSKAIYDIIARQSDSLLFECIAEHIASVANKFDLSHEETMKVLNSKVDALKSEILERV